MRVERQALRTLHDAIAAPRPHADPRLEVYRYGFGARTKRALEHSYPATSAALGEARWRRAGSTYCNEVGVTISNLNELGVRFPTFLAQRGYGAAVAELAQLEWLTLESLRAPRWRPLALTELAEHEVGVQPNLRVVVVRFNSLFRIGHPRARARRLVKAQAVRISPGRAGPLLRAMSAGEHRFARTLVAGQSFERAVEASRLDAQALGQVLAGWVVDGLLTSNS